jgi:hypothetical protein
MKRLFFPFFLFKSKAAEGSISQILTNAVKTFVLNTLQKVFSLPKVKFEWNLRVFEKHCILMSPQENKCPQFFKMKENTYLNPFFKGGETCQLAVILNLNLNLNLNLKMYRSVAYFPFFLQHKQKSNRGA